jgi:hypothetical protein
MTVMVKCDTSCWITPEAIRNMAIQAPNRLSQKCPRMPLANPLASGGGHPFLGTLTGLLERFRAYLVSDSRSLLS